MTPNGNILKSPRSVTIPRANYAPLPDPLTAAQIRFLTLHANHNPYRWQWHFQGATLRAYTERNHVASISKEDLADLLGRGYMTTGPGHDVAITLIGRKMLGL